MLFTSFQFFIFLIIVFILYWSLSKYILIWQNIILLISSYIFYGWWDWRFLFLLFSISLFNYFTALLLTKHDAKPIRKLIFILGIIVNVGTLGVFKYLNFFIDGFAVLISLFSLHPDPVTLNIILPIGISFYIFLSLSYIIDVYQHKLTSERNVVDVLLSLSFFPIILAGPIQRPLGLLPQIRSVRVFDYRKGVDGIKQLLYGLFMKIVIADCCAPSTNAIFDNYELYSGSTLLLGLFLFTIQIYADFAGYSNIAIALCKLLGFNIMQNFAYPYFAKDIKEFWKRWNISLTNWFRDYLFLPVAYSVSRKIKDNVVLGIKTEFIIYTIGIIITWSLTGLWHGANVTFIVWGFIHGTFLIFNHGLAKPRKKLLKRVHIKTDNMWLYLVDVLLTMVIVMFAWLFFKSSSIHHAFTFLEKMFSMSLFTIPEYPNKVKILVTLTGILIFLIVEWVGRGKEYAIQFIGTRWNRIFRYAMYYAIIVAILWFGGKEQQFIYFQF